MPGKHEINEGCGVLRNINLLTALVQYCIVSFIRGRNEKKISKTSVSRHPGLSLN